MEEVMLVLNKVNGNDVTADQEDPVSAAAEKGASWKQSTMKIFPSLQNSEDSEITWTPFLTSS